MCKRLLQLSLLSVLALMIGVGTANAQMLGTKALYRAQIPFDFVVGDENYPAGDYRVRVNSVTSGEQAVIFSVEAMDGTSLIRLIAMANGDRSRDDVPRLHFTRFGDDRFNYVLKKVVTPEFGYSIPVSKTATSVRITRNLNRKPTTVVVALMSLK